MKPSRNRFLTPILSLAILLPGTFLSPPTQADENESPRIRRRALLTEFVAADSDRRREILGELSRIALSEGARNSRSSLLDTDNRLPSAREIENWFSAPELSNAIGLGAVLAGDGTLTDRDIQKLIGLVARDGVTPEERDHVKDFADLYADSMAEDIRASLAGILEGDDEVSYTLRSEKDTWTSSYFPMAGSGIDDEGRAESNLWAKKGALYKLDRVIEERTGEPGNALEIERRPALNWLVGKPKGFYIPNSNLDEKDAERTTGVDLNGNGKIDENLEWDFIDTAGRFRKDGKKESTLSVGWWGRCNNVGIAGTLFDEPKNEVTINGVTFSPTEIKGLLAVYSDTILNSKGSEFIGRRYDKNPDELVTTDGKRLRGYIENVRELDFYGEGMKRSTDYSHRGDYVLLDKEALTSRNKEIRFRNLESGEVETFKPSDVKSLAREDNDQDTEARVFHNTMTEWLADGRAGVIEMDSGPHVWNYNYESAHVAESTTPPSWAGETPNDLRGYNGPPTDGEITYFDATVKYNGATGTKHYRYWIEKDESGSVINSGWASKNPDFMWRARETEVDWSRKVPGHPSFDGEIIRELYEKSTADLPEAPPSPISTPEADIDASDLEESDLPSSDNESSVSNP